MENNNLNENFTQKYLSKVEGIKWQTIKALIDCDYDSIHTLVAFDLSRDLDRLPNVSMAQKSLLQKVLIQLKYDFNEVYNKKRGTNSSLTKPIDAIVYINQISETAILQMIDNELSIKTFNTSESQLKPKNNIKSDSNSCQICGQNEKSLNNRLGVQSCEACRLFFIKVIKDNKSFQCVYDSNCVINTKTRSKCQFCRFQKCLDLGMNKDFIPNKTSKSNKKKSLKSFMESKLNEEPDLPSDYYSAFDVKTLENNEIIVEKELEKTVSEPNVVLTRISNSFQKRFKSEPIKGNNKSKGCAVCGGINDKGNERQFGMGCCGGCGTFFRRVLTNKLKTNGCVRGDGNCLINMKTRNQCKFCRFEKCLNLGFNATRIGFKGKAFFTKSNPNQSQVSEEVDTNENTLSVDINDENETNDDMDYDEEIEEGTDYLISNETSVKDKSYASVSGGRDFEDLYD